MEIPDNQLFISQGKIGLSEAKEILPKLEAKGIRFQIEMDQSCDISFEGPIQDERIELFVHQTDVELWLPIRDAYWPM